MSDFIIKLDNYWLNKIYEKQPKQINTIKTELFLIKYKKSNHTLSRFLPNIRENNKSEKIKMTDSTYRSVQSKTNTTEMNILVLKELSPGKTLWLITSINTRIKVPDHQMCVVFLCDKTFNTPAHTNTHTMITLEWQSHNCSVLYILEYNFLSCIIATYAVSILK